MWEGRCNQDGESNTQYKKQVCHLPGQNKSGHTEPHTKEVLEEIPVNSTRAIEVIINLVQGQRSWIRSRLDSGLYQMVILLIDYDFAVEKASMLSIHA